MDSGVPSATPVCVSVEAPGASGVSPLATPKSTSFTSSASPAPDRRTTFCAFKSRCTTPAPCALRSAAPTCSTTSSASSGGRGPRAASSAAKSRPSSHSMAMKGRPSGSSPYPSTATMCGWLSRWSVAASRRKRRSAVVAVAGSACITFSAAGTPVWRSFARYSVDTGPR